MAFRQPADFLAPFLRPMSEPLLQGVQLAENVRRFQAGQPLKKAQTKLAQAKVRQQEDAEKLFKQLTGTETLFDRPVGEADLFKDPVARAIINQATGLSIGKPEKTEAEILSLHGKKAAITQKAKPKAAPKIINRTRWDPALGANVEKSFQWDSDAGAYVEMGQPGQKGPSFIEKAQQAANVITTTTPAVLSRAKEIQPLKLEEAEARGRGATREALNLLEAKELRTPTGPEIDEAAANMLYQAAQFTENFANKLDPTFETVINKMGKKFGLKLFKLVNEDTWPDTKTFKALPEVPQLPAANQVSNRDELIQWVSQTYALQPWEAIEYLKELANAGTISFK